MCSAPASAVGPDLASGRSDSEVGRGLRTSRGSKRLALRQSGERRARPRSTPVFFEIRLLLADLLPPRFFPALLLITFLLSPLFPSDLHAAPAAPPKLPPAARGLLLDAAVTGIAIIAVGERGTIIRSADSGQTWETLNSPTHATLTGIVFATPSTGWIVGHDGVILHTRDAGETWTEQFKTDTPDTVFLDVAAVTIQQAIAVGAFGTCFVTLDGGRTWQPQKLPIEDSHLNRITPDTAGDFFIAGERGTLLRITSLKEPATTLPSPYEGSYYGVLPLSNRSLLVYGLRGHIHRSGEDGSTSQTIASPLTASFATAIRMKSGTIVMAGQARAFLTSIDDGLTFQTWNPPLTSAVAELVEAPNGDLLAFGEAGVTRLGIPPAPDAPAPTPKPGAAPLSVLPLPHPR